jgi:hypothetical protein
MHGGMVIHNDSNGAGTADPGKSGRFRVTSFEFLLLSIELYLLVISGGQ